MTSAHTGFFSASAALAASTAEARHSAAHHAAWR